MSPEQRIELIRQKLQQNLQGATHCAEQEWREHANREYFRGQQDAIREALRILDEQ